MAFNKKYYKIVKEWTDRQILHMPWCARTTTAEDHAKMYEKIMLSCIDREDYEGAKAVKDSIAGFLAKHAGSVYISKMQDIDLI